MMRMLRSEQAQARDAGKAFDQLLAQRIFALADGGPVQCHHPVQRGAEADGLGDGRRAGFEAARRRGPGAGLGRHRGDHAAAAEEGRHPRQRLRPAPEHADAGGAEGLVAGEGVEIDVQRAHILRAVLHGLRAVEQHAGAHLARRGDDGGDIGPRAGDVGALRDGDQPAAIGDERIARRARSSARRRHRHQRQLDAAALAQHLPGHEIAVVLGEASTTSSPALSVLPKAWATRLSAAVVPAVNTISSGRRH
jgi:hypothetical protein